MSFKGIKQKFSSLLEYFKTKYSEGIYIPTHRVVEILKNDEGEYTVLIQVIGKSITYKAQPEEILAKDESVDQFSPRDIRTLTYLGYLGINMPKYTVLAKRLSENNDKLIFALRKKGDKKVILKTADQILAEKEIFDNLGAKDANIIGYALGSESTLNEKIQKEKLHEALKNSSLD